MRIALDETNYHTTVTTTTKKSLPDRTKSAPHFGGVHRKVNIFPKFSFRCETQFYFSYFSNNICKYIAHLFLFQHLRLF